MSFLIKRFFSLFFLFAIVMASTSCRHKKVVENEWKSIDQTSEMVRTYKDDFAITTKILEGIMEDDFLRVYHINVQTYKGIVHLTGFVNSKQSAGKVVDIAESIKGVNAVSNSLIIQ